MEHEQTCITPLEDLKRSALQHYEELASKCHNWMGAVPQAIEYYYDKMIEEENGIPIESEESIQYRIQQEVQAESELKRHMSEMDKQIEYSDRIALRQLKLDAFRLASGLKPSNYSANQQLPTYNAASLIKDAEAIYKSLIS